MNQKSYEMHLLVYDLIPERLVNALRYMHTQYDALRGRYTNILADALYVYHAEINSAFLKKSINDAEWYQQVSPEIKVSYRFKEDSVLNSTASSVTQKKSSKSYWYALQRWMTKLKGTRDVE